MKPKPVLVRCGCFPHLYYAVFVRFSRHTAKTYIQGLSVCFFYYGALVFRPESRDGFLLFSYSIPSLVLQLYLFSFRYGTVLYRIVFFVDKYIFLCYNSDKQSRFLYFITILVIFQYKIGVFSDFCIISQIFFTILVILLRGA